jgi:hypothetical protein
LTIIRRDRVNVNVIGFETSSDLMTRKPRNLEARDHFEQEWLIENTWCEYCEAADLGIDKPFEYEEDGHVFIEGICRRCGRTVKSEIVVTDSDG